MEIPFSVKELQINDSRIIVQDYNPSSFGYSASLGSIFINALTQEIFQKIGLLDTSWSLIWPFKAKIITSNYLILLNDSKLLVDTNINPISLTLPSPLIYRNQLSIKNIGNKKISILPNNSETIDGYNNYEIKNLNTSITLVSDSINWWII